MSIYGNKELMAQHPRLHSPAVLHEPHGLLVSPPHLTDAESLEGECFSHTSLVRETEKTGNTEDLPRAMDRRRVVPQQGVNHLQATY